MKNLFGRFLGSYSHKTGKWVMAMLLWVSLGPALLKSVFMLIRQNSLPVWIVILSDLLGWVGAWLLFSIAISHMEGHHGNKFYPGLWLSFKKGGLWLIAMALLSGTMNKLYIKNGGFLVVTGSSFLYLLGMALLILFISLLMAVFCFYLICIMAGRDYNASFFKSLGFMIRKPLLCLGSIISTGLLLFGIPLLYDFFIDTIPGLALSYLELAAAGILLSIMQWSVLQPLIASMYRTACRYQESRVPVQVPPADQPVDSDRKPSAIILSNLTTLAAAALILATGLYTLLSNYPLSAESTVRQDLKYYMDYGRLMEKAGDHAAAAHYNKTAEARILAWQGAVLDQPEALNQSIGLAPYDEQVLFLAAVKSGSRLSVLEQGILNGNTSPAWFLALLEEYASVRNPNDVQKQRKAELLRICILSGYYCRTSVMPQDLTSKKDSLAVMLEVMKEEAIKGKHYSLLARMGEEGGVTRQLMLDSLDLAEKYPSQIKLQFMAMSYGSTYLEDGASHYGRTAAAALRYYDLYRQQYGQSANQEEMANEGLTVAKALLACGQLKTTVEFISGLNFDSPELSMLEASCQYSLQSYDKCLDALSVLLKENSRNPQALYLAAMSSLQTREITVSMGYALELAKLLETAEDKREIEGLLYPYLLRFTINDGQGGYRTEAYSTMNEEQISLLKSHEFLYNYLTAAHLWAKQDNDSRNEALNLLDKILTQQSKLSRAIYMKGAISFELNKDKEALECYKASLSMDDEQPTGWYALANLYDRMGRYDEAYAACQKVLDYLPSNNHNSDVYGVSIHATQLLEKLKPYIKEGE